MQLKTRLRVNVYNILESRDSKVLNRSSPASEAPNSVRSPLVEMALSVLRGEGNGCSIHALLPKEVR